MPALQDRKFARGQAQRGAGQASKFDFVTREKRNFVKRRKLILLVTFAGKRDDILFGLSFYREGQITKKSGDAL
jgi:hypothetical protein